jgi:hypothetical protein
VGFITSSATEVHPACLISPDGEGQLAEEIQEVPIWEENHGLSLETPSWGAFLPRIEQSTSPPHITLSPDSPQAHPTPHIFISMSGAKSPMKKM